MFYCVDRIYEKFAILISDGGEEIKAALNELPENLKEGCILTLSPLGYIKDEAEEKSRRLKTRRLLDSLFE